MDIGISYHEMVRAGFTENQMAAQTNFVGAIVESKLDRIESKFQNLATKDDINRLEKDINRLEKDIGGMKSDIKYLTYFGAGIFSVCATPALYNAWIYIMSFWPVK